MFKQLKYNLLAAARIIKFDVTDFELIDTKNIRKINQLNRLLKLALNYI